MASVNFKIKNRLTEKVYEISAPIGDRIDTGTSILVGYIDREGARYRNEGTEENPQWVISETMPYAWKRSYGQIFSYTEQDLNNNFIELTEEHELYDPDQLTNGNGMAPLDVVGAGGSIRLAMWTENVVEQGQTVTKLHSSMGGVSNSGWFRPNFGYPPGQPIGTEANTYGGMNPDFVKNYYVPDGKKPRISFHVETAKHGDYLYPILVVCGWYGYVDTSGETPEVKYGCRWQRAISTSLAFGTSAMQPTKTPSSTPNTTPSGGMGNRNNASQDVPMPGASGLTGLGYFTTGSSKGFHLYEVDPTNWARITKWLYTTDWWKLVAQYLDKAFMGSNAVSTFVLTNVKLMLNVTFPENTRIADELVYIGFTSVGTTSSTGDNRARGTSLTTRYAETQTWTFKIEEYSGTFLDFEPYTTITAHIPFCGVCHIPTDACMRGTVEIKYIVDVITGSCCAIVRATDQFNHTRIVSVLSGQCGINIPLTASDHMMNNITGSISSIVTGLVSGNALPVITGGVDLMSEQISVKSSDTSNSGGAASILGDRALYVAVDRPQDLTGYSTEGIDEIDNFGNKVGYAAASFCKVKDIGDDEYLEAIINPKSISTATDAEKEAIRNQLQRGVYI